MLLYNIQVIGGQVFVTYALQNAAKNGPVVGPGNGIVDIYELDGSLARRFVSHGQLNAPWGVAKASARVRPFQQRYPDRQFRRGNHQRI